MIKEKFNQIRRNPKAIRKIIFTSSLIASLLLVFLIGFYVGSYLEKRKVAPLKINLGGLEQSVIQSDELHSKIKWGNEVYVYDLRTKEQYDNGHIQMAVSMPEKELISRINEIPKEKEVVLYCQNFSCEEASQTVMILDTAKYKNCRVLFGGVEEWTGQGNKLVK
ncbi:MAG: rhodanese-like domain-containing protein [Candidatus Berkelbacteria bacterium]|nr:rhodanese-like domain-containing protein [Candidatus Berkelbacteria bacterium]